MAKHARINAPISLLVAIVLTAACAQDPPPLHQAVMDQDEARVEALLERGSDPNEIWRYTQPGHSGMTFDHSPLLLAVTQPNQRIIRLLVSHGADLYRTNYGKTTPFDWAIRFESFENAWLLWELSDRETYRTANPLVTAYSGGHMQVFDRLIEEVATPEAIGGLFAQYAEFGREGHDNGLEKIDELLALGLEPTAAALVAAVRNRNTDIAQRLLDAGVPIDGNESEYSPLYTAVTGRDMSLAHMLLERGADPNRLDPYGRIPAMNVVRLWRPHSTASVTGMRDEFQKRVVERLELLASYGADLNLRDPKGRSIVDFLDEEHDPDAEHSRAELEELLNRLG
jgi:ankyrin repeat protein